MIGVDILNDSQWTSHEVILAKSLPTFSTGGEKGELSALTPGNGEGL